MPPDFLSDLPADLPSYLPRTAWGGALFSARFKAEPEDFQVTENLDIAFSGEGEHLYLRLEKTERNTADVLNALKRCYKVPKQAIGFAGQKDRHAVTSQWFSVVTPDDETPFTRWLEAEDSPPIRCLQSARHSRKIRLGAHSSNTFVVRLKQVRALAENAATEDVDNNTAASAGANAASILKHNVKHRLQILANKGFPNYYGPQRFGRKGANVRNALRWLTSAPAIPPIARDKRSLYLSAVRSAAFNRVLSARVKRGNWNELRSGELCMLNGTNSVFQLNDAEYEATVQRAREFDVHPSAPLIGKLARTSTQIDDGVESHIEATVGPDGDDNANFNANAQDEAVLRQDPHHEALIYALTRLRVDAAHRSTRALCRDLQHRWLDDETLELSFTLAPGVYATTLLAELFEECRA